MSERDDLVGAAGVRSKRPVAFRQADISRAVKGAQAAGLSVASVQVDRDGRIVIMTTAKAAASGTADTALARWVADHAR